MQEFYANARKKFAFLTSQVNPELVFLKLPHCEHGQRSSSSGYPLFALTLWEHIKLSLPTWSSSGLCTVDFACLS